MIVGCKLVPLRYHFQYRSILNCRGLMVGYFAVILTGSGIFLIFGGVLARGLGPGLFLVVWLSDKRTITSHIYLLRS